MSDNFGPNQSRVLSVDNRSLDQVVFQDRRVPLTSEWNLINQISDLKTSEAVKVNQPSGWLRVGDIKDSGAKSPVDTASVAAAEEVAKSGDVITSVTYNSHRLKFACRETTNVAVVNGWPIAVQNPGSHPLIPAGQNDTDSFIELTLPPATGSYRYDIVFLEVWRKLVGSSDSIYPYGNVKATSGPYVDNEIVWDVIGAETTKRVQLQYRIRTYPRELYAGLLNTKRYPEGLGSTDIYAVGGNQEYEFKSNYPFINAGPRDAGLYIAGDGSAAAKEALSTVDGYVYAIPMFLVYRRAAGIPYGPNNVHGAGVTRSDALSGKVSDRPDGKYSDVIVADDIVDVRHQLITSGKDLDTVLEKSFRDLVTGNLKTTVGQGNNNVICSGGSECIKVEQLNGSTNIPPNISVGVSSGLYRRAYTKAELEHKHNVIEVPFNAPGSGVYWVQGTIDVSSFLSDTFGTVTSLDGIYFDDSWDTITDVDISDPTKIIIGSSSNLLTTHNTDRVYLEFTFEYESSNSGFYDVPKDFLEVGKYIYQPIAVRDHDLPVRYDNNQQLLTSATDDYVSYRGGNYAESYDFGHDLIMHETHNASSFSISCTGGKKYGYTILGVKRVQIKSSGVWTTAEDFSITRVVSGSDISFVVTITSTVIVSPTDIRITLITGSGSTEASSMKFFELSKQGRGIVDIYESIEVEAEASDLVNGIYVIDTGDKPIIAIHSYADDAGSDFSRGQTFAYNFGGGSEQRVKIYAYDVGDPTADINKYLPVLYGSQYADGWSPTRIKVKHDGSTVYPNKIRVAVLVHSYIPASESPYFFYYRFIPYQGILGSDEERGRIEKEGSAVITTEGSGQIQNFIYTDGTVNVSEGQRTIVKVSGASWRYHIEVGDYFIAEGSPYAYRIKYVGTDALGAQADTRITLAEPFVETTLTGSTYSIVRLDTPKSNISNVFDRMPAHAEEDYKGRSEEMFLGGVSGTTINIENKSRLQDPMDSISNDFQLGLANDSVRGRNKFALTDGSNSFYKLGELTPYIKYGVLDSWTADKGNKKVFQAYLFNKSYLDDTGKYRDLTGRLYLLVVSSETGLTNTDILLNPFSIKDSVDLYELSGRPIIRTT